MKKNVLVLLGTVCLGTLMAPKEGYAGMLPMQMQQHSAQEKDVLITAAQVAQTAAQVAQKAALQAMQQSAQDKAALQAATTQLAAAQQAASGCATLGGSGQTGLQTQSAAPTTQTAATQQPQTTLSADQTAVGSELQQLFSSANQQMQQQAQAQAAADQTAAAKAALPQCVQYGACTYNISTFLGKPGQAGSADGTTQTATITYPVSLAFDKSGNTYFSGNDKAVRKVDASGNVTTIGTGFQDEANDVDTSNNLYVFDGTNMRIIKYTHQANGTYYPQIIAGNDAPGTLGYAPEALFNAGIRHGWGGLIVDPQGNIFFSQTDAGIISKLVFTNGQWSMSTIAGTNGVRGYDNNAGNGNAAVGAKLTPQQLAIDSSGNIYVADDTSATVRKLTPDATGLHYTISTVAGNGTEGYSGDGGLAINAQLRKGVTGLSIDAVGNLYISDVGNKVIRFVSGTSGIITTIAGTPGQEGYDDNGGTAIGSKINSMWRNRVDSKGNLYIADAGNHVIRKLTPIG